MFNEYYEEVSEERILKRVGLVGLILMCCLVGYHIYLNWFWIKWLVTTVMVLSFIGAIGVIIYVLYNILYAPSKPVHAEPVSISEPVVPMFKISSKIVSDIKCFEASYRWPNESGYHAELHRYFLDKDYASIVEYQTGSSRPDIVIGDTAIEVKGCTTDNDIDSLPGKCVKYSNYYTDIVFVLFEPVWTRNQHAYETFRGMLSNFDNVSILIKRKDEPYILLDSVDALDY